jgi:hypothetical protein
MKLQQLIGRRVLLDSRILDAVGPFAWILLKFKLQCRRWRTSQRTLDWPDSKAVTVISKSVYGESGSSGYLSWAWIV